MPFTRKAFSAALGKSLKGGVRATSSEVRAVTKKLGLGSGYTVSETKAKLAFKELKEKGLLGARASGAGEWGFKEAIKKEVKLAQQAIEVEQRKGANVKMSLRSRIMEEERSKERITKALETGKGEGTGKAEAGKPAAGESAGRAAPPPMRGSVVGGVAERATAPTPVVTTVGGGPTFHEPAPPAATVPPAGEAAPKAVAPAEPSAPKTAPLPDMFGPDE